MNGNQLDLNDDETPAKQDQPRWDVDLHMQFDANEAATPTAAVSQFLVAILYEGMSGMTFTVRDLAGGAEGPPVIVKDGQICADAA